MVEVTLEKSETSIDVHLHYFFADADLHSMNADLFNAQERQFIDAIKKLNKYFDSPIEIEVFAKEKGGLIDHLKIVAKNPAILLLIGGLINAFFSTNFSQKLPETEETKNTVETVVMIKEAINAGTLTEEDFAYFASKDKGLQKYRSNFFKSAKQEKKLTQVEVETNTQINGKYVFDKITVPYNQFDNFILTDEDTPDETTDTEIKVKIYIIAPILVKGKKYSWKGVVDKKLDDPIDFSVSDNNFLEQVYKQEIKFSNGTYITGKMKITTVSNLITGKETVSRDMLEIENCGGDDTVIQITKKKKHTEPYGPLVAI